MTAANIWLTECDGNHCLRWFPNPSATAGNSQYHRAYYLINTALYLYYFTGKKPKPQQQSTWKAAGDMAILHYAYSTLQV